MKKLMVVYLLSLLIVSKIYSVESHVFTDIYKPRMFLVDQNNIYISDQNSVFVYDLKDYKLVKRLLRKGEGPQESTMTPFIAINEQKILINCIYKLGLYSKNFKFLGEFRHAVRTSEIFPVGDKYALKSGTTATDQIVSIFDKDFKKIKDFFVIRKTSNSNPEKNLIVPEARIKTYNTRIYLSQPHKGFVFDVFNQEGSKLYTIKKDIPKVKSEEKHRSREVEKFRDALGKTRFNKLRIKEKFGKRSLPKYLPAIKNFWVTDNKIYVKTHDINQSRDQYIILDLEGKILKTIFLSKAYYRKFCFGNHKFYYFGENDSDEGITLHVMDL